MSVKRNIPNSISKFYEYFKKVGLEKQEKNPIEKKHLDIEPFNHPEITKAIENVWFVGEKEEIMVWLIQTEKWNRKTWRNIIIRKLKNSLNTQIMFFIPVNTGFNDLIQEYSLSLIIPEEDGVIDIPSIIPMNPNIRSVRFWEAIEKDTLEDIVVFNAVASQVKHKLTAKELLDCLKKDDEDSLIRILEENGLKVLESNIILPRSNTPLKEAVLKIRVSEPIEDYNKELDEIRNVYREYEGDSPEWIIFFEKEKITYYSFWKNEFLGSTKFGNDNSRNSEILTTLIAIIDRRTSFNSETFSNQFGIYSPIFIKAQKKMKEFLEENYDDFRVLYEEWQRFFQEVYRSGDTDKNLFVKHSYLSLLIRITLVIKYLSEGDIEKENIDKIVNYFEDRGVSIFGNDFFRWATNVKEVRTDIFFALKDAIFEADDIFRTIYQQMVSPETRQALGEFYTPPELAKLMIDESYIFGQRVLDPACGSGTFLIEIIKKIMESNKENEEKIQALCSLYGFDVNPIAVSVTKANILLQISEMIQYEFVIPVQIFLCNSLFPLERSTYSDVLFGDSIIFHLHAINKKIPINVAFFGKKNEKSFACALRKLDSLMLKKGIDKITFTNGLIEILNRKEFDWMNQEISDAITKWNPKNHNWEIETKDNKSSLKDNFIYIATEFYNLSAIKSNHIWIYLLYNSLGVDQVRNSIDLVIGNPPWLALHNIHSIEYKERIKNLAKKLGVSPDAANISHLDISALFIYSCRDYFIKDNGKLFFVLSNSFVSSSNHDTTRKFEKLDNILIMKFTEDLFNIHNICLLADKNTNLKRKPEDIEVLVKTYKCQQSTNQELSLEVIKSEIYVPYTIERKKNKVFVKKLIPKNKIKELLPRSNNYYRDNVFNGATIYPRNFFFLTISNETNNVSIINPIIESNAKKPWDFEPYREIEIESQYIFDLAKSTELIPFVLLDFHKVFLPIERNSLNYELDKIKPKAKNHFNTLDRIYKEKIKKGASIRQLWNQINYRDKLEKDEQKSHIKVITNVTGSIVKAAIINSHEPIIIDYKLFYVTFDNLDEAYYYCTILNSPIITKDITILSSTGAGGGIRNISSRSHEYSIPKFNPSNRLHCNIRDVGKTMEENVRNLVNENRKKLLKEAQKKNKDITIDDIRCKPRTIQNRVFIELEDDFKELDNLVLDLLNVEQEE